MVLATLENKARTLFKFRLYKLEINILGDGREKEETWRHEEEMSWCLHFRAQEMQPNSSKISPFWQPSNFQILPASILKLLYKNRQTVISQYTENAALNFIYSYVVLFGWANNCNVITKMWCHLKCNSCQVWKENVLFSPI